jgi:hypothetical protein
MTPASPREKGGQSHFSGCPGNARRHGKVTLTPFFPPLPAYQLKVSEITEALLPSIRALHS